MSGSSARSRSVFTVSEDRPRAIGNRAWVAGWIHGQPAPRAQRPPRSQNGLGLFREGDHLVAAEPEPDARSIVAGRPFFGGGALAGDQHEHLARLVVSQPHFAHLPLAL